MIFWHQIAHDFTQPRVAKVAVLSLAAALVLGGSYQFDQYHWQEHQILKEVVLRHPAQTMSEGRWAATPAVARKLWSVHYAQGWYMAIGEGLVSVFLYTVL
jgi:hypothetical protein